MQLKDSKSLWGIPIVHLKEHSRKYRLFVSLLYLLDVIIVTGMTVFLYYMHLSYETYGFFIVFTCLVLHFTIFTYLSPNKWEAFKFYKSHYYDKLITKSYDINAERMFSVLYCLSIKRLKAEKSLEYYTELLLSLCCENNVNAKKVMKYLEKYESESGNLTCYIIEKGKSSYFIDYEERSSFDGDTDKGEVTEFTAENDSDGGSAD